jgi:hypothetical protein
MAQVIGRAGYDAVRKSYEELARASSELAVAIKPNRPYDESTLARLSEAVEQPALWLRGAQGECRTATILHSLPDDFVVFHDFHGRDVKGNRKNANIDHIVVGPTGVFVIDTKNHQKKLVEPARSSRLTKKHVNEVLHQALGVRDWLKAQQDNEIHDVYVHAIVVHVDGHAVVKQLEEHCVTVLPLRLLMKQITERGDSLTRSQVARIRKLVLQKRAVSPDIA